MKTLLRGLLLCLVILPMLAAHSHGADEVPLEADQKRVFIVPIRDDIMPPLTYLVRRGVKQAMEAKADLLVLDMDTHGGRVDVTEEIIQILNRFPGETVTYVNTRAFSAGAFIAVATQKIYMAPQSVIGAAAPIMLSPVPGSGPQSMPDTMEVKMTSGIKAMIRTQAERNGHNVEVVEAMIDKSKELVIDGQVLNSKGNILTLTDQQALVTVSKTGKPLLSSGTSASLDDLIKNLGYADAQRTTIKPSGSERLGTFLGALSPMLLIVGIIGIYLEFKTPGFGLPGIVGITSILLYFVGGYVAGFSSGIWVLVFALGLGLLLLEFFVLPGTLAVGLIGGILMLTALIMALVDLYPNVPIAPPNSDRFVPSGGLTIESFYRPLEVMGWAMLGSAVGIFILSKWLPRTSLYAGIVSRNSSGALSEVKLQRTQDSRIGQQGVTICPLRPGGKAQIGGEIVDVVTQGEMLGEKVAVRVIGARGSDALVEAI